MADSDQLGLDQPSLPDPRGRRVAWRALAAVTLAMAATVSGTVWAVPALAAGPAISSFKPVTGTINTIVTIVGFGFGGATAVRFGAGAATKFSVGRGGAEITAAVPASASTGPISVTTLGGTGTSSATFTVTPGLVLSAQGGHPAGTVTVSGAGFGNFEAVDVFFDLTDLAIATTNGTGNFAGLTVTVPASAAPGIHWITAVGRHSGSSAQVRYSVSTNWPQFGFSVRHKHVNPFENVLSPFTVAGIDLDWSFPTGNSVFLSSPAVVNGTVYAGSFDRNVYALNAATGAKLWSFATGGIVQSSPAVANGVVYVGSFDRNVYALNAATGAKLWSFATGDIVDSSPAVANGVVYVGARDRNVYAINAATGAKLWSFATGSLVQSSPAVANGVVYVGSDDRNVYAINAATGAKLWSFATGSFILSSPAVANGVVYVGSDDRNVYAINAATGTQLWSFATGSLVLSSPAVANGTVYIGSEDNNVYALKAATGAKLWSFATGSFIESSPAVANGVAYIGSDDGNVYAINAATGTPLWSFTTGSGVESSPAVVNGTVYVGSADHNVYAFDLPGGITAAARPAPAKLQTNNSLRPEPTAQS